MKISTRNSVANYRNTTCQKRAIESLIGCTASIILNMSETFVSVANMMLIVSVDNAKIYCQLRSRNAGVPWVYGFKLKEVESITAI